MFFLQITIAAFELIKVIPAMLVKGVSDHRCAHHITNLAFCHAGLELFDHIRFNDVALLYIDLVDAGKIKVGACAQHGDANDNQPLLHLLTNSTIVVEDEIITQSCYHC